MKDLYFIPFFDFEGTFVSYVTVSSDEYYELKAKLKENDYEVYEEKSETTTYFVRYLRFSL